MKYLLLLIFIGVPIAEIATFIKVGSLIGLWPTLATVVATAVIGAALFRAQGLAVLARAQDSMDEGRVPIDSVIHGLFLLVAGVLLLTPGFLTDAAGFLLLVPPARLAIARWLLGHLRESGHIRVHRFDMGRAGEKTTAHAGPNGDGLIIEGEIVETDETVDRPRDGGSPRRQ